jgi:phosphomethylpyrimidine synthase
LLQKENSGRDYMGHYLSKVSGISNVIESIQEVKENLITSNTLLDKLQNHSAVLLKGKNQSIAAGEGLLVKVNVSLGISNPNKTHIELKKLSDLTSIGYKPDTIMDLSIVHTDAPLYLQAVETFGGPVGTLPHYLCFNEQKGIEPKLLLDEIERQAERGVSFMTLHLTPRKYLYEKAIATRLTPITSRGGGIIIRDMYINNREESVISLYFDQILQILRENNVTLSIGTAFRPANTIDTLDEVQLEEIKIQGEYIMEAQCAGVQVMMEGMGHSTLNKIAEYVQIVRENYSIPVMPLGPIPTDAAVGEDHIASAIGASFMAYMGGADIINAVTREEHTGKVPTTESVLEGLRAARIASHTVNIARFSQLDTIDNQISKNRAKNYTCVVEGGLFSESSRQRFNMGCSRCEKVCPLLPTKDTLGGVTPQGQ